MLLLSAITSTHDKTYVTNNQRVIIAHLHGSWVERGEIQNTKATGRLNQPSCQVKMADGESSTTAGKNWIELPPIRERIARAAQLKGQN